MIEYPPISNKHAGILVCIEHSTSASSVRTTMRSVCVFVCILGILTIMAGQSIGDDSLQSRKLVQKFDFGRAEGKNFYGLPSNWKRRIDRDFPVYLKTALVPESPENESIAGQMRRTLGQVWIGWRDGILPWNVIPETVPSEVDDFIEASFLHPCLEIQMDGGSVELHAPSFSVEPGLSYSVELKMATYNLADYTAEAELVLMDRTQNIVKRFAAPSLTGNTPWKPLQIGPIDEGNLGTLQGQVRLRVIPKRNIAYKGIVRVDRMRVWKMPMLALRLNKPLNFFERGEPILVTSVASGLVGASHTVRFELIDHLGKTVHDHTTSLQEASDNRAIDSHFASKKLVTTALPKTAPFQLERQFSTTRSELAGRGQHGKSEWQLPSNLPPGYYTLKCQLGDSANARSVRFIVWSDRLPQEGKSRFGLCMTDGGTIIPNPQIPDLIRQCGMGAVKIPIWIDPDDTEKTSAMVLMFERLGTLGIEAIGVLDVPPPTIQQHFSEDGKRSILGALAETAVCQPLLEPSLMRMSMSVQKFQVGWDRDNSFRPNKRVKTLLEAFRAQLKLFAADSELTIPWNGLYQFDKSAKLPIDRLQISMTPPQTATELRNSVTGALANKQRSWISLEPISSENYSFEDRILDLANRMIAVVEKEIDAAFIPDPYSTTQGIFSEDGQPNELLMPVASLAHALSGTKYIGRLSLPNKSTNYIFKRGESAICLAWNSVPTEEKLYFGENVVAEDLWGKPITIQSDSSDLGLEQRIPIGTLPIIIRNVNLNVARWCMGIELVNPILESVFGKSQNLNVRIANPGTDTIRGRVNVVAPSLLLKEQAGAPIQVAAGDTKEFKVPIELRTDASAQKSSIRLDLSIRLDAKSEKDHEYRFSVFREIQVGSDDIEFQSAQSIDEFGNLVLRIELLNRGSQPVSFESMLILPDRPRERTQFVNIAERSSRTITIPDGSKLVGKTLRLRCKEFNTDRVINKTIVVVNPEEL